ncbi:MAG: hypothetical protein WD004_03005 [Actinomycetota bacterium]
MAGTNKRKGEASPSRNTFVVASVVLAMAGVAVLFLMPYLSGRVSFPVGTDTKKYIWRATLAADQGLGALPGSAPPEFEDNPDRPGYPAIAATVWGTMGIDPVRLAEILPAVMAIIIGLGAGVFAVRCLGHPRWVFAIFLLVVGASIQVARTAVGYADNLIVDAVLMAAAVAITVTPIGRRDPPKHFTRRSMAAAAFLLTGAAVIHWIFALVFLMLLGVVAVFRLPSSLRARRSYRIALPNTESGRLVGTIALTLVCGFIALLIGPALPSVLPSNDPARLTEKFQAFVPLFSLSVTVALAATGAVLVLLAATRARWRAVLLALAWAAVGLVAVWAFDKGVHFAAYRFLGFALGIPLLGAVAIVWPGRLGRRSGPIGRVLGATLMVVAIGASVGAAQAGWNGDDPMWAEKEPVADKIAEVETVERYLMSVGWEGPIVFVDQQRTATALHLIRAVLPADLIPRTYAYLGDTETLLSGKPTIIAGEDEFNRKSLKTWPSVEAALAENAVVVDLSPEPGDEAVVTEGFALTDGITILRGPLPTERISQAKPHLAPSSPWSLVWRTTLLLMWLAVAGLGWSVSLIEAPWAYRLALAPAFGIATLALGGVVGSRFGASFSGTPIKVVTVVAALLGWVPLVVGGIRSRGSRTARA